MFMKAKRSKNTVAGEHWGIRLQKILNEKRLSLRELSRHIKVSPSVISGWLKGNSPTDLILIKNLSEHLGVSFSWLLTGEHEKGVSVPSMSELFDELPYFDGYARIRIDRLITKKDKKGDSL